jgi:hypothetical protein
LPIDLLFRLWTSFWANELAESLEVWLRDLILSQLTIADATKNIQWLAIFTLPAFQPFLSDGLLRKGSLSTALLPVLIELAAEAVPGAPLPVVLDRCKAETLDVI